MLALPVRSSAYAWETPLNGMWSSHAQPSWAKAFYGAIAVATLIGVGLNFSPIDPIKAHFWSAVINGLVAGPVVVMMMHLSSHRPAMGDFQLDVRLKIVGWLSTRVMAAAAIGLFAT
jgi:Mn2+/Fe2+ NRAMP family transporter